MMKKIGEMVKNTSSIIHPACGNDNKPHILRPRAIAFVVWWRSSPIGLRVRREIYHSAIKAFGIIEVNALVDETNQNRVTNGLPDLQVSSLLTAAAQDKANDEATKGYFAHTSPQGLRMVLVPAVGYNFDYAGENLAVNFSDSEDVTTAWMNSPEHRANILSTDFTQIGIAAAQGVYEENPPRSWWRVRHACSARRANAVCGHRKRRDGAGGCSSSNACTSGDANAGGETARKDRRGKPATIPKATPAPVPVAMVPVVVAMQSSSAPAMQQTFIAVQGEATQTFRRCRRRYPQLLCAIRGNNGCNRASSGAE